MLKNFFSFRPKKFLGVDIGTTSIRVVEISGKKNQRQLENYGEIGNVLSNEKPFRVFESETLSLSDKDIAGALKLILQEAGTETKEAIFSIPDFCTFFTTFDLPVMGRDEMEEAVKYEVRSYVPIPLADITLNWTVIQGEASKTPVKILVAAVLNDIIGQYQSIAALSGLSLKLLEPEVFALARSSVKGEDEKKVVALIDLGASSTTCSILENKILKISHSFNIAGNELTQALVKYLNVDYNKAEELKMKYGLSERGQIGSSADRTVKDIISPLIDSMIEETRKTLRDFYKNEGKEVEKIILAGGMATLPGIGEYFSAGTNKSGEIAVPFSGINYDPILAEKLKQQGSLYAIAIGLALKGFE
jgi:type IV pilus assembly protein PilM